MAKDESEDRPNFGDVSHVRGKIEVHYLADGVESYNTAQLLRMNSVTSGVR